MSSVMLDLDPTIVVGGILPEIGSNAKPGKSEYFVAEADESDNSFLFMKPSYAVITNVEEDHLDTHGCLENINKSFLNLLIKLKWSSCVYRLWKSKKINWKERKRKIVTYSIREREADIFAYDIQIENGKTSYNIAIRGKNAGRYTISIPGYHNILNSLPVIYYAKNLE